MATFEDFNLDPIILKTLQKIGYSQPTEIQEIAIPIALKGEDIIASAATGTGKTGAFLIPTIQRLLKGNKPQLGCPKVLVLVPTRELAEQVAKESGIFSAGITKLKTVCIYGGVPYPIQQRALSRPFDILIATPGRLLDHIERRRIDLSQVETLILDEADRMLDMGFVDDVKYIASLIPLERQTMLFSATLDQKIISFSKQLQNNPHEIRIKATQASMPRIDQTLYIVDDLGHKVRLLEHILLNTEIDQVIVFTSTKSQANRLSEELNEKGHHTAALHGDKTQRQRTKTLDSMRQGKTRILVATDVASRGIDVPTISHVINFDLPQQAEDFIHRIGRTGRAGRSGSAITFASRREQHWLPRIEKMTGCTPVLATIEGLEPRQQARTSDPSSRKPQNRQGPARFGFGGGNKRKSNAQRPPFARSRG